MTRGTIPQMISYGHHRYPGRLFVVEGTDGSGKSTQLALLYQWLKAEGYPVIDEEPRPGSRGTTVAFVHPKGAFGTLIELVEEPAEP